MITNVRNRRLATAAACLTLVGASFGQVSAYAATSNAQSISCAPGGTLNGEGSTAQGNAVSEWISRYQGSCKGTTINYNATGSGAGIKQFTANQVDWAGSDSVMKPEEADAAKGRCGGNPAWHLPMAVGPIAVAYNPNGLPGGLILDGPTIAKIFTGQIKKWNDGAIAGLNNGASLPDKDIKVFFRSDESGTTQNFTSYLQAAGGGAYGGTPSKQFDGGVGEGQAKSAGVQQATKATDGGVTYVEYSFARDAKLGVARVLGDGGPTELTPTTAGNAVLAAAPTGSGNDLTYKLNYADKQAGVYPIVLITYEIVCSKGLDGEKTGLLKTFLNYTASPEGQQNIVDIGYGKLPGDVSAKVAEAINAIS